MVEFAQPMGDPKGCKGIAGSMTQLLYGGENCCLACGVEQRCGLVEQEEIGLAGQGASNGEPLLLASAERVNGARCHARQPHLFQQLIDPASLLSLIEPGGQVQEHFAAAAGEQELVVWVLEHQCRAEFAVDVTGLGTDQTAQDPKQRALAASIAAHQHPEPWAGNPEAAAIKRTGTAGPAVADPLELQCCLLGSVLRGHSGFEGKPWALGSASGGSLLVDLHSQ